MFFLRYSHLLTSKELGDIPILDIPIFEPAKEKIPPSLVGGFNPFEKYARQIGSSPGRGENKKYLKPPPSS